jgi:glycine/D-amino acid oxidase-like deaminating enzyme
MSAPPPATPSPDVIVIGAGIVGTAAAVFLAEGGARVTVLEADVVAGAASGRNAGSIQHPLDAIRAPLYEESVALYRRYGVLGEAAARMFVVAADEAPLRDVVAQAAPFPSLAAELLDEEALRALEPALAPGLAGCLLRTGHPARPAAATNRFAEVARERGVRIQEGARAQLVIDGGRVTGVRTSAGRLAAGAVLVAAGPWTPDVVDPSGAWRPVRADWGVTVQVDLPDPPRHRLEEAETGPVAPPDGDCRFFEATPTGAVTVLGATHTGHRPDERAVAAHVLRRAARIVPAVARASIVAVRACPRPVAADDVPLIGPLGIEGLHVATGHGAYGISLGPGSARLAADALLHGTPIPPALAADRFGVPATVTAA